MGEDRRMWPWVLAVAVALGVATGGLLGLVRYANDAAQHGMEASAGDVATEVGANAQGADAGDARQLAVQEAGEGQAEEPAQQVEDHEVEDPTPSGWVEDEDGTTRYYDPKTHEPSVGWVEIDGTRHYFDEQGRKVVGWVDGDDGKRYWVKPEDGLLASHEWVEIEGVYQAFDDDGSWVTLGDVVPPYDEDNVRDMTERQRAVVAACDSTPWPGKSLCAAWVSSVFSNAGGPSVGGDACDMARAWCTSSSLDDLKPGMIIAVTSHGRTDAGKTYGHVCVYIGEGLIRDSGTYGVRKSSLGSWLAWFGDLESPKWGWAGDVDLSAA